MCKNICTHTHTHTHTHTLRAKVQQWHTAWVEALETSHCWCLHHGSSNVGSGAAQCILRFFLKQGDEVREQAPYSYRQRRTDWFVYHQYLQMSIWAPLRKLIFQHEAECSEKSLVLVLPQSEEKTEIYTERETAAVRQEVHMCPENISLISPARQSRRTDRQTRKTDCEGEILNCPIIS